MSATVYPLSKTAPQAVQAFNTKSALLLELDPSLKNLKLQLPENLCASSAKKLQGKATPLTPDHPLFAKLYKRITLIEAQLTKVAPEAKFPLSHIQSLYQDYIYQNCHEEKAPLLFAAKQGHLAKLNTLLAKQSDPTVTDSQGRTAMHLACIRGHTEIVKALYKISTLNRIRDHQGQTPLHLAAFYGHEAIVQIFVTLSPERIRISDSDLLKVVLPKNRKLKDKKSLEKVLALVEKLLSEPRPVQEDPNQIDIEEYLD